MRNLDEIIRNAMGAIHTTSSGPVLEILRELAADGRFEEAGEVLQAWFNEFPHTRTFVSGRVPAIVLNNYLIEQQGIPVDSFTKWEQENPDWSRGIRAEAGDPKRLPMAVAKVLQSIRDYGQDAP